MNIKDIAQATGVSIATVSRVINGKPGVKEEVKAKVLKAIQENDYRPNLIARGLVSRKSNLLGLMIPQVNSYYTPRIEGVFSAATKNNYGIIMASTVNKFQGEADNFFMLAEKQVEGIIYFASKVTEEHIEALKKIIPKIPVVIVDQEIEELEIPCIIQDNYHGASKVMSHLIEKGCRKIAFIKGGKFDKSAQSRYDAYRDMLEKNNLPFIESYVGEGTFSIRSGYRETEKIITSSQTRPDAIFAANDRMAMGVLSYLSKNNIKIPNEISVAGFDDIEESEFTIPPLTTIRQEHFETGKQATEVLIDFINTKKIKTRKVVMNQELIVREST